MGRGRAKAKQTKVARDLKYRTLETDFSQLQQELHGGEPPQAPADSVDDGVGDPGSDYADHGEGSSAR